MDVPRLAPAAVSPTPVPPNPASAGRPVVRAAEVHEVIHAAIRAAIRAATPKAQVAEAPNPSKPKGPKPRRRRSDGSAQRATPTHCPPGSRRRSNARGRRLRAQFDRQARLLGR